MAAIAFGGCVNVSDATNGRVDEFLRTLEEETGISLTGITAEYVQGTRVVYPGTPLNDLKAGLTVTAKYMDNTTKKLADADYALSGTLAVGTSTITVTYEGQTATFTVTVKLPDVPDAPLVRITAVYSPGPATTVLPTTPLNNLKNDLTVTATYGDSTEIPVASAGYTLSGTLTQGTNSTVTVSYTERGVTRTTTFTVAVAVPMRIDSISVVYSQTRPVYYNTALNSLKSELEVTAYFSDGTTSLLDTAEYTLTSSPMTFTENETATITVRSRSTASISKTFTVMVVPLPDAGRLYAKIPPILQTDVPVDLSMIVAHSEIERAFTYVNAVPGTYTFMLDGDIEVTMHADRDATSGAAVLHLKSPGTKLAIIGDGVMRTISGKSSISSRLFTIGQQGAEGIEFTLGNNITIDGATEIVAGERLIGGYVYIQNGATFNMQDNAVVTRSGINVNEATFTMQNSASVSNSMRLNVTNSTFTMMDNAKVHGSARDASPLRSDLGGVFMAGSSSLFTMQDNASVFGKNGPAVMLYNNSSAIMMNNAAVYENDTIGVLVPSGCVFTMRDNASVHGNGSTGIHTAGTIVMQDKASVHGQNTTLGNGGGVLIGGGTFTMRDETSVYNNTAFNNTGLSGNGGGVFVGGGTFTIQDAASVYNNTATTILGGMTTATAGNGGGVYVNSGSRFTMEDDTKIYGNTANIGGGVYVASASVVSRGIFTMNGGTIYGNNDGELANAARTMAAALFVATGAEAKFDDDTNIIPIGNGMDITIRR